MNRASKNMEVENVSTVPANPENGYFGTLGARIRNVGQRKLRLSISVSNLLLFIFDVSMLGIAIWMMSSSNMQSNTYENGMCESEAMMMEIEELKEAKMNGCEAFKKEIKGLEEDMIMLKEEMAKKEEIKNKIKELKEEMAKKEEIFKNKIKKLKEEMAKKEEIYKNKIKELKEEMAKKEGKISIAIDKLMGSRIVTGWIMLPICSYFLEIIINIHEELAFAISCVISVTISIIVGTEINRILVSTFFILAVIDIMIVTGIIEKKLIAFCCVTCAAIGIIIAIIFGCEIVANIVVILVIIASSLINIAIPLMICRGKFALNDDDRENKK